MPLSKEKQAEVDNSLIQAIQNSSLKEVDVALHYGANPLATFPKEGCDASYSILDECLSYQLNDNISMIAFHLYEHLFFSEIPCGENNLSENTIKRFSMLARWAAEQDRIDILEKLWSHRFNIAKDANMELIKNKGHLRIYQYIFIVGVLNQNAAVTGMQHWISIRVLGEFCQEPDNLLRSAIEQQSLSSVKIALDQGADPLKVYIDDYGYENTALDQCLNTDNHNMNAISFYLYEHLCFKKVDCGESVQHQRCALLMHIAAQEDRLDILEKLANRGYCLSIDHIEVEEYTRPIDKAAMAGHLRILKFLIEKGVQANISFNLSYTALPIHFAAESGQYEAVKFLMKYNDINAIGRDDYEATPLILAISRKHTDIVELLLQHGADCNFQRAYGETTALQTAIELQYLEIAELLIHTPNINLNLQDRQGETALHYAVKTKSSGILILLLEKGCNLNLVNHQGKTALHLAVESGSLDIVTFLLEKNPNINIRDIKGKLPKDYTSNPDILSALQTADLLTVKRRLASVYINKRPHDDEAQDLEGEAAHLSKRGLFRHQDDDSKRGLFRHQDDDSSSSSSTSKVGSPTT